MSNRSNHPVSDTDHRGDRRADDGHDGFEEDPLVELARIVSEGNAKFRPVAMTEPRFEEPAFPQADDPEYVDPSGWEEPVSGGVGWNEPFEQQPVSAPDEREATASDYSDAYAQRVQSVPVSPPVDVEPAQGAYGDTWHAEVQAEVWDDDAHFAEASRSAQVEWPDGPVNRSADVADDFGQDPYFPDSVAPRDEGRLDPPVYQEDVRGDANFSAEQERARAITADLSASLEDELLGPQKNAHDDREAWSEGDDLQSESYDDLLMDAPAPGWADDGRAGRAEPQAPSFDEDFYAAADTEAPPPPEGYDLDAVAQAMREGDPQIGGHGVLPPHSESEQEVAPDEKSRRGLFAAGAVLGLVVAGGAVFAFFDFGGSDVIGPPPVITASQEPLKVYPEGEEPSANGQSKLIYDRVGGVESPREERLVVQDETPVASLPPAPVTDGDAQTRVPAGPRRVRTVVVRPDGTIISGDDAAAATDTPSASQSEPATDQPAQEQSPSSPVPRVASVDPAGTDTRQVTTTPVTAPGAEDGAAVPQAAGPTVAGDVPTNVPREKPGDIETMAARATAPPAIQRQSAPAQRAPASPLDLTASQQGASQPAASAPATSGSIPAGAYIVQVSSQRTQDQAQAAFDNLQQRYAGVLGGVSPVIQRADLGDRGTFYRVRIPASSRDDAISLCERLKSAGGDCFVRRN
ncbi:SPOR domain-containing protein [Stappia sp. ES.058]|uniref:SPOR domain-containing protein n=1 Tax=Stappia sp. ES.058 TaxID=1881061 RepID=UPI00087CC938|nr:SPOR domain-containing protein [Stappia sp. ES.058]SDU12553.1 Cell division protein FtsN [Stappia sp. ES.058]